MRPTTPASATVCVLGEGAKVNLLGYGPAVGKFVKVNDSWMEVVGVLTEQVMAGAQNSGGTMLDVNNIIYIPLNTMQYRFWDQGRNMKDELDGIDLRLRADADSIEVAKVVTAVLNSTHHSMQDFSVTIPAALLAQQQRTQTIFTYVMVAIAAIWYFFCISFSYVSGCQEADEVVERPQLQLGVVRPSSQFQRDLQKS